MGIAAPSAMVMRLCMVLGYRPSPGGGGTEKHVFELIRGLVDRGMQIDVMCEDRTYLPDGRHDLPVRFLSVPTRAVAADDWFRHSREKSALFASALDPDIYDIVHSHNHHGFDIALKLAQVSPRPALVTTFHLTAGGLLDRFERLGLGKPDNAEVEQAVAEMEARGAQLSDVCVAVSDSVAAELCHLYAVPPSKISTVPNWYDPHVFSPLSKELARDLLGLDRQEKYLLYVGEFRWHRGNLMRQVMRALPAKIKLLVIHPDRNEQIEAEFGDRVRFLGYVPHDQMRLYYAASDLQCFPAVYGGFGLVLIEGMACGCPPVVFDLPAMNEIVTEDSGYLVCDISAEAYAEAIVKALMSPHSKREAAQRQAKRFQLDEQIDTVFSLYQTVAQGASALRQAMRKGRALDKSRMRYAGGKR